MLELANLEHRLASREADCARAAELRQSAGSNIERTQRLLESDPADVRNRLRLFIAETNQALCSQHPSLYIASCRATEAYDLAKNNQDVLMAARACYKLALIESRRATSICDCPPRARFSACRHATEALRLSKQLHNDRLTARIHTLLGNLFLEYPFRDIPRATSEWEAAEQSMVKHKDLDYVVKRIRELGVRIESARSGSDTAVIFTVHAELAFGQRLEQTIRDVERAIVLDAVALLGPSTGAISDALRTGHDRIERYLEERQRDRQSTHVRPSCLIYERDDVIFNVSRALAFSQPLEVTVQDVERAIVFAACSQYGCDESAITRLLVTGGRRVRKHLDTIRAELQSIKYAEQQ